MAVDFFERPGSPSITKDPPTFTQVWGVTGTTNSATASAHVINNTPTSVFSIGVGLLYRQDVRLDPNGWNNWTAIVKYGQRNRNAGEFSFSFDTTGATTHISAAKQHIASFPGGDPANPHKGAIGVTKEGGVQGCDVIIPNLVLTYTVKYPLGIVDEALARSFAQNTGKVNVDSFRGFAPGELLFLGATGLGGTNTDTELSIRLAANENTDSLSFGDIVGIIKQGWHYAWIEFKDAVEQGKPVTQPSRAHIERVYDFVSFLSLFGFN